MADPEPDDLEEVELTPPECWDIPPLAGKTPVEIVEESDALRDAIEEAKEKADE